MDRSSSDSSQERVAPASRNVIVICKDDIAHDVIGAIVNGSEDMFVLRANSPEDAGRVMNSSGVDVVLAVCNPGEGAATLERLKAVSGGASLIVQEVDADAAGVENARSSQTCLVITAPANSADLLARLVQDITDRSSETSTGSDNGGGDCQPINLKEVTATLSRVNHDINNPLSIISGNAQLLLELAGSLNLGEDLIQPAHDIEEASRRASAMLGALSELAQRLREPVAVHDSAAREDTA